MVRDQNNKLGRVDIIRTVKSPLGFFTLVVLITEAILGITLPFVDNWLRAVVTLSMVILIFILVAIVLYLAVFKTDVLLGTQDSFDQRDSAKKHIEKSSTVLIKNPAKKEIVTSIGAVTWISSMDQYIGSTTKVMSFDKKTRTAKLDVDSEFHDWSTEWLELR